MSNILIPIRHLTGVACYCREAGKKKASTWTASSGPEVFVDHLATLAQHVQKHQPSRAITCDHVQGQQGNLHVIGIE